METHLLGSRYLIQKEIAVVGNSVLFIAYDSLKEKDVLLTNAVFPALAQKEKERLRAYYQSLVNDIGKVPCEFLSPVSDFYETSFSKVSPLEKQSISKLLPGLVLSNETPVFTFISHKKTEEKLLGDLIPSIKANWEKYFLWVLQALSHLHAQGIICYHISPFSIFCSEEKICLANAGIVPPGHLFFSPSCYASPEILHHESHDCRSDLYSLASLFYHLITGEKYEFQKVNSGISSKCNEILEKCLQLLPQNRFKDAIECAEKLFLVSGEKNLSLPPRQFLLNSPFPYEAFPDLTKKILNFEENNDSTMVCFAACPAGTGKTAFLEQIQEYCDKQGYFSLSISCSAQESHPFYPFLMLMDKLGENFEEESGFSLEPPLYSHFSLDETYQHARKKIANVLWEKAKSPFVLLIDDLQWASKETLDIIKYLIVFSSKQENKNRLRILAAYHKEKNGILERFLEKLSQETLKESIYFFSWEGMKDLKNISSWITETLGMPQAPVKFISQLSQATGNNLVFMQKILLGFLRKKTLYQEHGEWCIAGNSNEGISFPKDFQEAMENYLATLPQESILFLQFLCLSGSSLPMDCLLNYSKSKNIEGAFLLWEFYRDRVIRIEKDFMVSLKSSSFWEKYHSDLVSRKELLPGILEDIDTFWKSNLRCFFLAGLVPEGHHFRFYYKEIFSQLAISGMEDSLEKWLEKYLSSLSSETLEDCILIAEMAFYLRMQSIAFCYFEKVQKKGHYPLALLRLYEMALWDENWSLAEQYSKTLEKEEGLIYKILRSYLDASKKYLQKEEKFAWQSIQKALELCQQGLKEGKEKEKFFSIYCQILQNKSVQSRASQLESEIALALDIAFSLGNLQAQIKLYALLALAYKQRAEYYKALETYQKSLDLTEKFAYPSAKIDALSAMGEIYTILGCYKKADSMLSQSVQTYKTDKIKGYMAKATLMKARIDALKDKEKAQDLYQEALQIARKYHDKESIAFSLLGWSEWLISRDIQTAILYWQEARPLWQSLLYPCLEIYASVVQAKIKLFEQEPPEKIRDFLKEILSLAHEKKHREYLWQIYAFYAESYKIQGNLQEAERFLEIAKKILQENVQSFSPEIQESYWNSLEIKRFLKKMSASNAEPSSGNIPEDTASAKITRRIPSLEESILPYQQEVVQNHLNSMREENNRLRRLLEINKKINKEHNLRKLLDLIMDTAIEITKAERGFLILTTTTQEKKAFEVARNFEKEDISHPEFEISHSITENTIRTGIPILATDAMQDDRFDGYRSVSDLKLHSVLVVPLKSKDKILGAVYIDNRFEKAIFSEKEKILLEAFSDQAAIAIENARLFEENQKKQTELEASKSSIEELNQKLALANAKLSKRIERKEEELKEVKNILQNSQYELESVSRFHNLIGKSKRMQEIFQILEKIADKNIPIFIHGESGTGKELVARAIHFNGNRKEENFLSENCAAITESLLESELFGHTKGSFTGAYTDKKGLFELASSGTLFLDEIGDMSPNMQAKLLRVLETNKIRRVGGKDEITIDVRIISASNKSLVDLVSKGLFREDLFFRLKVVQIDLPPLRERKEDIPLIVEHFLAEYAKENKTHLRSVDKKTLAFLMNYHWPGNIRELKNMIYNVLSLYDEEVLTIAHFKDLNPSTVPKSTDFLSQELSIDEYAKIFVLHNQEKYNDSQLARILGFSRKTLWEKRKKWGILKN